MLLERVNMVTPLCESNLCIIVMQWMLMTTVGKVWSFILTVSWPQIIKFKQKFRAKPNIKYKWNPSQVLSHWFMEWHIIYCSYRESILLFIWEWCFNTFIAHTALHFYYSWRIFLFFSPAWQKRGYILQRGRLAAWYTVNRWRLLLEGATLCSMSPLTKP